MSDPLQGFRDVCERVMVDLAFYGGTQRSPPVDIERRRITLPRMPTT